ncbi:hypothetical protein TNCV_739891 [Trichonephila clavipes]|nr:hypothetical protein TNCV_739891 [Trichonephila clavipes]
MGEGEPSGVTYIPALAGEINASFAYNGCRSWTDATMPKGTSNANPYYIANLTLHDILWHQVRTDEVPHAHSGSLTLDMYAAKVLLLMVQLLYRSTPARYFVRTMAISCRPTTSQ